MRAQPRVTASQAFWITRAPRERRLMIEAALERLDGLRDRLLDAIDAEANPDRNSGQSIQSGETLP